MRTNIDHEAGSTEMPDLLPGSKAANFVNGWTTREQPIERRDLPSIIHALRSRPVLSRKHRLQLADLLERLSDQKEPFKSRPRKRGRPRKPAFNYASVRASAVAAEYVLALCAEGGWEAKPRALTKGLVLADRLYSGHDLTKRELDDMCRRYKAAGIVPRSSWLFEECSPDERNRLENGNDTFEAYREAAMDVDSDPEQQALVLQCQLYSMANFVSDRIACALVSELAEKLLLGFQNCLQSQFEADFAESLRAEIDEKIIDAFFARLSTELPEAIGGWGNAHIAGTDVEK